MKDRENQKGFVSLQVMYLILSLAFFLLCGFKIIPVYIDDNIVKSALTALGSDPQIDTLSSREIKIKMRKKLMLNNIRGEIPEAVKMVNSSKGKFVTVDYVVRIPVVANIDVVVSFQNHLDTSNPAECCKPASE
jgi:hypothetical protein